MRDITLAFLVFLIGVGSVKTFEEAFSHYPITGIIIFSLGFSGLIAFIIGNIKFGKPKIEFGEYGIGAIDGILSWYVPIRNKALDGWLSSIYKRNSMIEVQVRVRFMIEDKLIADAIHWDDFSAGITLSADSAWHQIPLVQEIDNNGNGKDLLLAETRASTSTSNIPPHIVPTKTDIITVIKVTSRRIVKAQSRWCINLDPSGFTKVNIRPEST